MIVESGWMEQPQQPWQRVQQKLPGRLGDKVRGTTVWAVVCVWYVYHQHGIIRSAQAFEDGAIENGILATFCIRVPDCRLQQATPTEHRVSIVYAEPIAFQAIPIQSIGIGGNANSLFRIDYFQVHIIDGTTTQFGIRYACIYRTWASIGMQQTCQQWSALHDMVHTRYTVRAHQIIRVDKDEYIIPAVPDADIAVGSGIL